MRIKRSEYERIQLKVMSKSRLQDKWMRKIYAGVGRSFRQSKMKDIGRNPHRQDEVPKNSPSR